MALFAYTLSPHVRADLLIVVQSIFVTFVVASFLCVAIYTTLQIRQGSLFTLNRSPVPFLMRPPMVGWVYILTVLALIYIQSVLYALVVLAGVAGIMLENSSSAIEQFGLRRLGFIKALGWGFIIFGAVTLVETPLMQFSIQVLELLRLPHPEQQAVETFRQNARGLTTTIILLQAVVVFPVVEELFFRGFLLTFLKNYTSTAAAIVISAGVFAFAHQNLAATLPLWFLGIALGIAYEHTGSILVPMTVHGCFNLATALSLLIEKGHPS